MPTTLAATRDAIRVLEARRAGLTPLDAQQAGLIRQLHELRAHAETLRGTL